jgi:hypothetical protein
MIFKEDAILRIAQQFAENRYNMIKWKDKEEIVKEVASIRKIEESDLKEIKWLWEKTLIMLIENWIKNKSDLKEKGITFIKKLKINPISFNAIKKYLEEN